MLQQHLKDYSLSPVNLFKMLLHQLMMGERWVGELDLSAVTEEA